MSDQKDRVLFLIKLPPPITGATIINGHALLCFKNDQRFQIKTISISYKASIEDTTIFSFHKIYKIFAIYYKLIGNLIFYRPSIVYFQISPTGIAFYRDCTYIFLIKLLNVHILYHLHGKGINEFIGDSSKKYKLYFWAFKESSVICLSTSMKNDIKKFYEGIPYIVNNGIEKIKEVTKEKYKTDCLEILFLSNLIYSKGILDFLESIVLLKEKLTKISFKGIVIGKEVDLNIEVLNNEISSRGLSDSVKYLGAKYNQDKQKKINDAYVLVYPSYNDSFPLTILEAMQAGLPVIATKEGGITDIIDDGITGFLVDKHRPDQIAEKLEFLINNTDLREKMSEFGKKKFLEKYTLEVFERNIKNVFKDVITKTYKTI
jgi:glycosyltransferase involved in cell wall biosynthesis